MSSNIFSSLLMAIFFLLILILSARGAELKPRGDHHRLSCSSKINNQSQKVKDNETKVLCLSACGCGNCDDKYDELINGLEYVESTSNYINGYNFLAGPLRLLRELRWFIFSLIFIL